MIDVLAQVQIRHRTGKGCVAENGFCPDWIADNLHKYWTPLLEHVWLTVVSVAIGFVIAFVLALICHRQRWLTGIVGGFTGALYTVPSVAAFLLLLPVTGRGNNTAIIALTAYTLLILFRNIVDGLDGVPEESRDAGRGMGFTAQQLLWRIELPLALPTIMAGLRIAATTTVGLAALATYAGAGGLGDQMASQKEFISNVAVGAALCVLMAVGLDAILLLAQRLLTPWSRARTA
jgi:osmoprotectant transport system permease protein